MTCVDKAPEPEKPPLPFSLALIAGGVAGISVDVALYPLDTLKTRLQDPRGFKASGGFSGIYRGVVATALGAAPGAGLFFSAYETMKPRLKEWSGGKEHPLHHACAASCGEVAACVVRVPTEVVKQNMQVGKYETFLQALSAIASSERGMMSFFTGYWTTVAREIPFAFIQFPMYEGLKKAWAAAQGEETAPWQGAACGSISGATSGAVTCPLDVVKTRMMLGAKTAAGATFASLGLLRSLRHIHAEEGGRALFHGIGPRVGWITLGGYVFFGAYEKAQQQLWQMGSWGQRPAFKM